MEPTGSEATVAQTGQPGAVRACQIDPPAVRAVLQSFDRPRTAWVDTRHDSATQTPVTVIAGGAAKTLTANGTDRFKQIQQRATDLFAGLEGTDTLAHNARPRLFGGFAFTETHDPESSETWTGYPGAEFILPAVQLVILDETAWLTTAAVGPNAELTAQHRLDKWHERLAALPEFTVGSRPGVRSLTANPERDRWRTQVEAAVDRIEAGQLRKVVLAQSVTASLANRARVADILYRLGQDYPDCYRFLFEPGTGGAFFGATPERLVARTGTKVKTEALAGSIGRGTTEAEDDRLAQDLLDSEKNAHEHQLVVDAVREQLSPLTTDIHCGDRAIRRLANVQHIHTPISATLAHDEHILSLVEALHPTPAVGGLPPAEALETIRETEAFERGWYAAPVGWFDADGDGEFAVAIRSGIATDREVTLFAGAGIVTDSDPDREWEELQLKYRPVLNELE